MIFSKFEARSAYKKVYCLYGFLFCDSLLSLKNFFLKNKIFSFFLFLFFEVEKNINFHGI